MDKTIQPAIRMDFAELSIVREEVTGKLAGENLFEEYAKPRENNIYKIIGRAAGKPIVGYLLFKQHSNYLSIEELGLVPYARRKRYGTTAINWMKRQLGVCVGKRIEACVSDTDFATHQFLKCMGFIAVKMRRAPWDKPYEHEYIFHYTASDPLPFQGRNRITGRL